MAIAKKPGKMLQIRLLPEIDAEFRKLISRRGDVRAVILTMFEVIDLKSVPLLEMLFRRSRKVAKPTTLLNFPVELHSKMKRIAKARGCSMNALMNGGMKLFVERLKLQGGIPHAAESGGPKSGSRSTSVRR